MIAAGLACPRCQTGVEVGALHHCGDGLNGCVVDLQAFPEPCPPVRWWATGEPPEAWPLAPVYRMLAQQLAREGTVHHSQLELQITGENGCPVLLPLKWPIPAPEQLN